MPSRTPVVRYPPLFVDTAGWIESTAEGQVQDLLVATQRSGMGLGKAHTSDYVLLECYSYILKHRRREAALAFLQGVDESGVIVHPPGGDVVDLAVERARERPLKRELSLVDWTSVVLMEQRGIRHILTTDRAFAQLGFEVLP